jgi:hypothetical protein
MVGCVALFRTQHNLTNERSIIAVRKRDAADGLAAGKLWHGLCLPVALLIEFDKEGKIWFDTMHQGASVSFRVFGSNRREQMRLRLISGSDRHNATIPSHFVCER